MKQPAQKEPRRFGSQQKAALYSRANGRCESCQAFLEPGWEAHHIQEYSTGGATDVLNGQALCQSCHQVETQRFNSLRTWQKDALNLWQGRERFMLAACPGSGKTRFALEVGRRLVNQQRVQRIIWLVPNRPLVDQTCDSAVNLDLRLVSTQNQHGARPPADAHGQVCTYQQVSSNPLLFRAQSADALIVLDEAHHMGDEQTWGDSMRLAFDEAPHILLMTGTPWRQDNRAIPFAVFDGANELVVDFLYGHKQAWADPRPPIRDLSFIQLAGIARIPSQLVGQTAENDLVEVESEGVDERLEPKVLESLHEPDSDWFRLALEEGERVLSEAKTMLPTAQGLIIARDKLAARGYAQVLSSAGLSHELVLGDDAAAHRKLKEFPKSGIDWLIAVKMVTEGFDNNRLAVEIYATAEKTPTAFHQGLGRVCRKSSSDDRLVAKVIVPKTPSFERLVAEVDEARAYAIERQEERDTGSRELSPGERERLEVGAAIDAHIANVIHKGASPTDYDEVVASLLEDGFDLEAIEAALHRRRKSSRVENRVLTSSERHALKAQNTRLAAQVAHKHKVDHSHVWFGVNHRLKTTRATRPDHQLVPEGDILREYLESSSVPGDLRSARRAA